MERENHRKNSCGDKIVHIKKRRGSRIFVTNHGYVLIFSLWAIVILGFISLNLSLDTGIAIKTEIAYSERIKNIYAARGACLYATQMILLPEEQEKKTNDGGDAIIEKEGDEEDLFSRLKNKPWGPSSNPYSVEIGGGNCDVYISDENGKININGIKDDTREGFIKFLTSLTISEIDADTITGSILDWVDKDSLHHINGAESDYYATLPDPYEAKNGPFETIEELALVKGVTPKIYEMLREHVTMYGSGKINVNYASREVLQYVPLITPEIAEGIITLREEQGKIKEFGELKELFRSFGIVGSNFHKILDFLTVYDSNYVTINSISSADGIQNSYKMIVLKGIQHFRIVAVYPE